MSRSGVCISKYLIHGEQGSPASEPAPKVAEDGKPALRKFRTLRLKVIAPMSDDSKSEHAEEFLQSNDSTDKSGCPTRSEREEQLRKMMEDDGMSDSLSYEKARALTKVDDEPMETTDAEANFQDQRQTAIEARSEQSDEPPAASTITTSGRRRGRKKVMKKKTLKDEEGYLGMCSPTCPIKATQQLIAMHCSDYRRARVGILFRRRTSVKGVHANINRLINDTT